MATPRTMQPPGPMRAIIRAVLVVTVVAPIAVGIGVLAGRLAGPDGTFVTALGVTAAAGLLGGIMVPAVLARRSRHGQGAGGPPP